MTHQSIYNPKKTHFRYPPPTHFKNSQPIKLLETDLSFRISSRGRCSVLEPMELMTSLWDF
ncbi:hypothetical protein BJJLLNOG_00133 [Ostreid herpesvirus 1]|nr:hypothetical protein MNKOMGEJ_00005 [Ostreid herpesvirus 1]UPX74257.1 hypothetical protein MNKOMGEJ_00133 [Ostreid herpesvirus 1]UPX74290.1 hypothetical protein AFLJNOPI_00005 [Ostreid herpesvirus 1]UPX74418.1 hypothetical protein AFLJNOPI_00133 [Ostreid herpesvirus 1]UPX74452.1 hypothetical protein CJMPFHDB_00006 [Ostreid herpesvirus 1]